LPSASSFIKHSILFLSISLLHILNHSFNQISDHERLDTCTVSLFRRYSTIACLRHRSWLESSCVHNDLTMRPSLHNTPKVKAARLARICSDWNITQSTLDQFFGEDILQSDWFSRSLQAWCLESNALSFAEDTARFRKRRQQQPRSAQALMRDWKPADIDLCLVDLLTEVWIAGLAYIRECRLTIEPKENLYGAWLARFSNLPTRTSPISKSRQLERRQTGRPHSIAKGVRAPLQYMRVRYSLTIAPFSIRFPESCTL